MPISSVCDCSLSEIADLVRSVERDDAQADQLIRHPRAFFEARGFCAPSGVTFRIVNTNELRARLLTEDDIDLFLRERAGVARSKFEVHIGEGKGKCTKLEVE
jgi:hypothetical protein